MTYPDQDPTPQYQPAPPPNPEQPPAAPPGQPATPSLWPEPAPAAPAQSYEPQLQSAQPQPQPDTTTPPQPEAASKRAIIKAAIIAGAVASVLLVIAVLPAEYGVDPTGAGKALGLKKISETGAAETNKPAATSGTGETQTMNADGTSNSNVINDTPTIGSRLSSQSAIYKTDTVELSLKPRGSFEYKFNLEKDAPLLYSWTASASLKHEFHGEPKDGPKGSYQSYKKATEKTSSGSLVAPFAGTHGWYWKNNSSKIVTITLTTSGYYTILGLVGEN